MKRQLLGKRQREQQRQRKDESQIMLLIREFRKGTDWTKTQVVWLSNQTGLSESQVYKWAWDQKKKFSKDPNKVELQTSPARVEPFATGVTRDEFGGYCCKRWTKENDSSQKSKHGQSPMSLRDQQDERDICRVLKLDIEAQALKIVEQDL